MIIESSELAAFAGKVAMVDGGFDPLHAGHVLYFEEAAKLGLPVLCNVQSDEYIKARKARANLLPEDQRAKLIDALATIEYVHICRTTTRDVLDTLAPALYVKGADWDGHLPQEEQDTCSARGTEIVYLDTVRDSSTDIVGGFLERVDRVMMPARVAEFERLLNEQRSYDAEHYDSDYFQGDWREGENDYSIERRREIEAKNPQNIKDVFEPTSVLDVGCGPGALMYFLHELGLDVYGVDFSEGAKALAPVTGATVSPSRPSPSTSTSAATSISSSAARCSST
jgi:cytidyltransferase-like protein